MLTALYDLAQSPLTFDFAYAVAQAEAERRRGHHERLSFHIKTAIAPARNVAYASGEPSWRLRHILIPLSQMLAAPSDIHVGTSLARETTVFSKPHGLHWLSDVALLAEAGEDVQLLEARSSVKAHIDAALHPYVQGRRIITITLRETRYATARNSDLQSWASLARQLPRDKYAVIVLRDHERVSETLPGDWGEVIVYPGAVWSLHQRAALYELAWLNLAVNNGPLGLLALNSRVRFMIFKMIGGTPETSPQHFRRLGIEPGMNFPFLRSHQHMVWESDHIAILRERIFSELSDLESETHPPPAAAGSVFNCLLTAARRDYRCGGPAADTFARIPQGPARASVAMEGAAMFLEENRYLEAALALQEGPECTERDHLATTIAHACCDPKIVSVLSPIMAGNPADDWHAALERTRQAEIAQIDVASVEPPQPLVTVCIPSGANISDTLICVGAGEYERRRMEVPGLHIIATQADETLLSVAALFPAATSMSLCHDNNLPSVLKLPASGPKEKACGMAIVPERANVHLNHWLYTHKLVVTGYALKALQNQSGGNYLDQPLESPEGLPLKTVYWHHLAKIWPIEMLAALVAGAKMRILGDPTAVALSIVLGLPYQSPDQNDGPVNEPL